MPLTKEHYRQRLVDAKISDYLKTFGAISIEGPKWCGKTWTALNHAESSFFLNDPKNGYMNRMIAEINPDGALDGLFPRLLDEWQEVPALWDAVRFKVDSIKTRGQYILTGSTAIATDEIKHSGTGRFRRVHMRTMSLYESGDSSGDVSLSDMFVANLKPIMLQEVPLRQLVNLVVRGGWPDAIDRDVEHARELASGYLENVHEDMFHLDGIRRDKRKVEMLLRSLARNESTVVSNNTLLQDIQNHDGDVMNKDTVSEYLNAMRRLYLIEEQEPFAINLRSSARVGLTPKRHFADTSLTVAALGATSDMLMEDLNTFGFLFEALAVHDLKVYAQNHDAKVFHYRDSSGREIDAIVQLPDGRWGAFEIKLGAKKIDEAAANLLNIYKMMKSNNVDKLPSFLCVICGLSNMAYTRPDGVRVVPLTALRD